MSWTQMPMMIGATMGLLAVVGLVVAVIRRGGARSEKTVRAVWVVGGLVCAGLLFTVGAGLIDLGPGIMPVDVGVLSLTGILTGAFLAMGLNPEAPRRA